MTSAASNLPVVRVPKRAAKKVPGTKKSSRKGIFGQLPKWKIDTQAFRDEMRR